MDAALVQWVLTNGTDLLTILGGLVTVASIVTKLTPTPMDDALLSKLQKLLRRLSVPGFKDEARTVYITQESLPLIMKAPK
jgi:hypothetical protein